MPKKGNGYDSAAIVAQAIQMCGCQEQKFLACAERFGNTKGVTSVAHPGAIAFANWVALKSRRDIGIKMSCRTS